MRRIQIKQILSLLLALLLPAGVLLRDAAAAATQEPLERSETVYVTATATGEVSSILSSVYIVNPDGREQISDVSRLTDVRNILSNETPKRNGDALVFQTDGDDVCYQGASDDALPFSMEVAYTLDGEQISPEELAGRSGHVGVTITYTNRMLNTVETDSGTLSLYTPLNIVTIIALNDGFSSVQCTNAHVLSEAGSISVFGLTFPGLAENLEVPATDELSNSLHFEADVTSFTLDSIMAVVMPDIFDAKDLERIDELQTFVDGVATLGESGNQLAYGASKLASGTAAAAEGVGGLADGVSEFAGLVSGIDGAVSEAEGKLDSAVDQASGAIDSAVSSIDSVQSGDADAIADAVIAGISGELTPELEAEIRRAVKAAWNAQIGGMNAQLTEARKQLLALQSNLPAIRQAVEKLFGTVHNINNGMQDMSAAAKALKEGMDELTSGARSLSGGISRFCKEGLAELVESTNSISLALDRKDAMLALAEAYTSFSGDPAASTGSVRFIVTTESIYVPKVTPEPEPVEAPEAEVGFFESIWNWITGLFGG